MITWGINALNHDASIAVVSNGKLTFWKKSSEFSGIQGDDKLHYDLIKEAISASNYLGPSTVVWYEKPWLKKLRQIRAGQWDWACNLNELPSRYLKTVNLGYSKISYMPHHKSHAAAGFLTSPFEEATIVVLDAIGEWESATIWNGRGTELTKLWSRSYPTSLGLFYSAFTDLIGLKPLGEEHILQQRSELGDEKRYAKDVATYWNKNWELTRNLHKGVTDWPHEIKTDQDRHDIAAAVQLIFEYQADWVMLKARELSTSKNLVYMGGCAMNSKYNKYMSMQWDDIWTLSVPGDASSSLGAALYYQQARVQLNEKFKILYG
jgi:carbamoyltransferase